MESPEIPADEDLRLETLKSLHILDTDPEERFDRITRFAQNFFAVPIAVISLVDQGRQWFKSIRGLKVKETSREVSFCGHAILNKDLFIVTNTLEDARFLDNPLVADAPYIRFYAGCPLIAPNGTKLGTLCLIDQEPRIFTTEDKKLLQELAKLAQKELTLMQVSTIDEVTLLSNLSGFQMLAEPALTLAENLEIKATLLLFCLMTSKSDAAPLNVTEKEEQHTNQCKAFARHLLAHFDIADIIAKVSQDGFAALLMHAQEPAIEKALSRLKEIAMIESLSFETQQITLSPSSQTLTEIITNSLQNFSAPASSILKK